jgi:hypothetical protein
MKKEEEEEEEEEEELKVKEDLEEAKRGKAIEKRI